MDIINSKPPSLETGLDQAQLPSPAVSRPKRIWGWLDDRLGLSAIRYKVPAHANTFWYTLGGITFIGIVVLAVTGIYLAQYYDSAPEAARQSVIYIQNVAPFGGIIRGIHVWSAYIVVITSALHMIRVVVTAAYKIPREINWLVGLALLAFLLFVGVFTGTILRWDQESYEAMTHNMLLTNSLGGVATFFSHDLNSNIPMVSRLYTVHVSLVPLILIILLIAHFFLIKHHGLSPTAAQADRGEAPGGRLPEDKLTGHYPTHLRLMVGYGLALLGLAGALAVFIPQAIGPVPDPAMEVTKPPFVFFWLYPFENWFGLNGILYSAIGLFGLLTVLPFIDRTPLRALRQRKVALVIGVVLLVAVLAASILTAVQPVARHLS